MKKGLLIILAFISWQLQAQILIPKFEAPVKISAISDEAAEEIMPLPFNGGEGMYFVRTYVKGGAKERRKAQEIWSSSRTNGVWSEPTSTFEEANDLGNNGVIGTSKDGNKVYVFNSIQTRRKLAKGIAYTEKNAEGEWSDLKKLEIKGFEIGEGYYSFYMSPNEDILLISMAASDTTVREDLFVSLKEGEEWGEPINLGSKINTNGYEISPFIAKDGKSLYFSSTGHGGEGDADIFVSYRQDDSWTNWSKPLNLGSSINSSGFDAYFIIGNKEEVYFSSNRGQQYSDVYYTKITEKAIIANQEASNEAIFIYKGLPADNVKLGIYDPEGNLVDEVYTDAYGKFKFEKLNNEELYLVKVIDEDADEFKEGVIYIIDDQGNKLSRLVMLDDGELMPDDMVEDKVLIQGVFEYDDLPRQNAALVILDENGFPLDTIYTDKEGRFEYMKLAMDDNITIKPLEVEDVLLENIGLYLTDDAGTKILDSESKGEKGFSFKTSNIKNQIVEFEKPKKETVESKKVFDNTGIPVSVLPEKLEEIGEYRRSIQPIKVLQFDFNSFYLDGEDWSKLHKVATTLRRKPNLNVELVGHTDTSGTKKVNSDVSEQRALQAKKYLMRIGIDESRITTKAMKDTEPIASNTTREGRIKNRRVEVFLKD